MQRQALTATCEARGWRIVGTFEDPVISGAKGRDKRPGFDRLMKAVTTHKIDIVAAWPIDRLGRSLKDHHQKLPRTRKMSRPAAAIPA